MTGSTSETSSGIWRVPECRFSIEYSPPILDEIRRIVVDAFFSLPRGGVEIGGILLGKQADECVRITAFRPMECEHAFGPTFVLSDKDKIRLGAQLEELRNDPALRDLEVVGWYHSHTRSEIFLSELDLDLYREFFPKARQVALVMRPAGMKPTRAGFFFRHADGTVRSEASCHEFVLGAPVAAYEDARTAAPANGREAAEQPAARPASPMANPPATTVPVQRLEEIAVPATPDVVEGKKERDERQAKGEPEHYPPLLPATALLPNAESILPRRTVQRGAPPEAPQAEFAPPAFLVSSRKSRKNRWLWLALILVIVAGAAYYTSGFWLRFLIHKNINLHLQALDKAGQLHIQWDRDTLGLQDLRDGTLEIIDGPLRTMVPLDPTTIRAGSFQYLRRSEIVEMRMTVRLTGGGALEEFTSFIGQPPPRFPSAEVQPQQGDLAAEAEKARADLAKEELRRKELERSVEKLRDALRREQERRRVENQMPGSSRSAPSSGAAPAATGSNSPRQPAGSAERPAGPVDKTGNPQTAPMSSLSGHWVFSPASKTGSPFPPESVSLVMTENSGQVRGIFTGRYRVPQGRKFNPNVKFSFEGAVHPGSSRFPFATASGMKGDVEVIRLPGKQDAIEVVWYSDRDKLTFDDIFFRVP